MSGNEARNDVHEGRIAADRRGGAPGRRQTDPDQTDPDRAGAAVARAGNRSLETTAALRLSPLLAAYVAAWPEFDLVLRTGTTRELIEAVRECRLQGEFVCGPVSHPALAAEAVVHEELAILTAPAVAGTAAAAAAE